MSDRRFYFDPGAEGIRVFLGPTEARLMELAWEKGPLSVKRAIMYLGDSPPPAYTGIMTIMSRLAEKGLLERRKEGRSFVYTPTVSRDQFIKRRVSAIQNCLKTNFGRAR